MVRNSSCLVLLTTLVLCLLVSYAPADVLKQSDSVARFGEKPFSYFFFEAEDFDNNDPRGDGESWILTSDPDALDIIVNEFDEDPETGELVEPDPEAFASGDESITNVHFNTTDNNEVGGQHDVQYLLNFDTPGDYYLYIRHHSPAGPELNRNGRNRSPAKQPMPNSLVQLVRNRGRAV